MHTVHFVISMRSGECECVWGSMFLEARPSSGAMSEYPQQQEETLPEASTPTRSLGDFMCKFDCTFQEIFVLGVLTLAIPSTGNQKCKCKIFGGTVVISPIFLNNSIVRSPVGVFVPGDLNVSTRLIIGTLGQIDYVVGIRVQLALHEVISLA